MGLHLNGSYVLQGLGMTLGNANVSIETRASYGAHFLDHLAAHGAGLTGGQVTVVAVGQVHADLPWCPFYILNSPDTGTVEGVWPLGANSLTGSDTISPMNL